MGRHPLWIIQDLPITQKGWVMTTAQPGQVDSVYAGMWYLPWVTEALPR